MKKFIVSLFAACLFVALGASTFAEDLTGKWSLTRTNDSGETVTQTLEVMKDGKFTFRIAKGAQTVIYARGDCKLKAADAIKIAVFDHIEGGATEDDLKPSDDGRQCVYVLDDDSLTFAVDFDKDRGQSPRVEVYHRVKS
jgi:hypothetical protein